MVAYTTAKNIAQVANSSYVGTWDVPTNANWAIVDAALGQFVSIALNNSNVTLSAAQFQCYQITFTSQLNASVSIIFPSSFTGPYVIQNLCTNSSLYTITLGTTVAGGQVICCKPGEPFDAINDGTNLKYKNLGHIGSYWDYAGSSVPNWVNGCTVPPYLNCDASQFSSATYPALTTILGSTTLPDIRGVSRAYLNQGTNRIQAGVTGLNGDTLYATGGSQYAQQHSHTYVDPGHAHQAVRLQGSANAGSGASVNVNEAPTTVVVTGITINNSLAGNSQNIPPTTIAGICMIRAA